MDIFVNLFSSLFGFITDIGFLGIPILVWLLLPAVIGAVINFIQGKR